MFSGSNSDVPPTLESNLGFIGAKEGTLGDNKYLNNLKDNKGTPDIHQTNRTNFEKSKFDSFAQPQFDQIPPQKDQQSRQEIDQQSKFVKNLLGDFDNNTLGFDRFNDRGLFRIPEKNQEYEFGGDLSSGLNFDQGIGMENENNDGISKLLDFGSENSREFEIEDNKNRLGDMFNSGEKKFTPQKDLHFQTPVKDFTQSKEFGLNTNLFSTIPTKKVTNSLVSSDFMNSTNVTEPSVTDFFSTRKGELTSSCRKEPKYKMRSSISSRFENDYEILEVKPSFFFSEFLC